MFNILLSFASMTGLVQYDYSNFDKVIYATTIAQEQLQHDCIPMYNEATMSGSFVKIPHYCGLEITTNTHTMKQTMKETTFDIVVESESMSFLRTNYITKKQ